MKMVEIRIGVEECRQVYKSELLKSRNWI